MTDGTTARPTDTDISEDHKRMLAEMRSTTFAHKGDHPTRERIDLMEGSWYATHLHEDLTWMRANAPVYHDPNSDVWAVTRYDDVRAVSTNPSTFSSHDGIVPKTGHLPMMIAMDGTDHRKRRGLVSTGFTPRRVAEKEAEVREICEGLVDDIIERGEADFVWDVAALLPLIVIGNMLGIEHDDRDQLLHWSDQLIKATTGQMADAEEATAAFIAYVEYQKAVIANRREHPQDDLVTVLTQAEVEGERLTDDELLYELLLILVGGDETTRHVVSGGLHQLVRNPDQLAALREDRSLLPGAIEEMLRWVTPIKTMSRKVTEDIEVGGQTIPAGDEVMLQYLSANRDEDHFDDPFTFDIRRDPNRHLAFGQGPHFCLGSSLAKLELTCMFEVVLDRMHDIQITAEDDELEWRPSSFISGLESLPITFTPGERRSS